VRKKDDVYTPGGKKLGKIHAIDLLERTVDIKKPGAARDRHASELFAYTMHGTDEQAESLLRLGQWVADHGIDAAGKYRAARDLLLKRKPRLCGREELQRKGEGTVAAARRIALALNHCVLPIQGPPGAGKTFTGARMICDLVCAGKKIGITAV